MNDAGKESTLTQIARSGFGFLLVLVAIVVLFLLMMAGIGEGLIDLGISLLFGWVAFLTETLPRISWKGNAIWIAILCVGIVGGLSHWFLNWLSSSIASSRSKTFSWPWKWTMSCLVAVGLCFLVGMAAAGAAHQIGWIAEADEPLFEDKFRKLRRHWEMQAMAYVVEKSLNTTNTADFLRANVLTEDERGQLSHRSNAQSLHLLMLMGADAKPEGVLIFPRDSEARQRLGGIYQGLTEQRKMSSDGLLGFIRTNELRLMSF